MKPLWPHQKRGVGGALAAIRQGHRRVLLTSPTGGGKTRMMAELIRHYLDHDRRVVLYTNRRLLLEQTSGVLEGQGFTHGLRAAGCPDDRHRDLQVSSVQTEYSRSVKGKEWLLHDADLVLVDEAHLQKGEMARAILAAHLEAGAAVVGLTATPLGLGEHYDVLVQAGTVSELRACGALVRCDHYGPDEPDLRHVRKVPLGEDLSESECRKAVMVPGVFGRVWEHWRRLNPDGRPTILFAPGVQESVWFAQQFEARGVRAASIDGKEVYVDGKFIPTSKDAREAALRQSREGRLPVLCNRFVLREGVDAPWLAHGIVATVFGSLGSYLQAGGRLLRAHPGLSSVTLQDHGGCWWRHGSLNADREWRLDLTERLAAARREDAWRNPPRAGERAPEPQPLRCPRCARVLAVPRCPCGWALLAGRKARPVVQADGSLLMLEGDVFRPRRIAKPPRAEELWERMYHRAKSPKYDATFRAAYSLFARENDWTWLPQDLPLMPKDPEDWYRKVADVPLERLHQKAPQEAAR